MTTTTAGSTAAYAAVQEATTPPLREDLMTIAEVSKYLGGVKPTIYEWVRERGFPPPSSSARTRRVGAAVKSTRGSSSCGG
jgi:excisionase family DNA binding protein